MTRKLTLLSMAVGMVLAAVSAQAQEAAERTLSEGGSPLTTTCTYPFTASNIKWCLSANGNLVSLQSPGTVEHIRFGASGAVEGYALCVNGALQAWDNAAAGTGFGAAMVTVVKTDSGITIRRKTLDGKWQLDQKWSRDNTERDLTVQMTLKNLGSAATNVVLWRSADINVDYGLDALYFDRFDQSRYSLWFRDPVNYSRDAVTMSVLTFTGVSESAVGVTPYSSGTPFCSITRLPVPGGPQDVMGHVGYAFYRLASGAQKVVKVGYRVQ